LEPDQMKIQYYINETPRKLFILLLFGFTLAHLSTAIFNGVMNHIMPDWSYFLSKLFFYCLALYLTHRKNLLGFLIIIYMAISDLNFADSVLLTLLNKELFIIGPTMALYNLTNILLLAFAIINLFLIILKYFKPQLFQQTANNVVSGNFFKRHQLDMVLASIILVLLAIYWLVWWACTTHI